MRKISVMIVALAVAGIACADFGINWKNQTVEIQNGGAALADGALVQLIWIADNTPDRSVSKAGVGGATAPGEILMASVFTASPVPGPPPNLGLWNEPVGQIITDAQAGGSGANTGYVFSRIFVDGGAAAGTLYWDSPYLAATKEIVYNGTTGLPELSSFETANTVSAGADVAEFGTTVIPEPATLGLMGIAGLGMFLARKKTRR